MDPTATTPREFIAHTTNEASSEQRLLLMSPQGNTLDTFPLISVPVREVDLVIGSLMPYVPRGAEPVAHTLSNELATIRIRGDLPPGSEYEWPIWNNLVDATLVIEDADGTAVESTAWDTFALTPGTHHIFASAASFGLREFRFDVVEGLDRLDAVVEAPVQRIGEEGRVCFSGSHQGREASSAMEIVVTPPLYARSQQQRNCVEVYATTPGTASITAHADGLEASVEFVVE